MAKGQDNQTKKTSFLQWLFLIIIPLILAITITFIILSILDLNPGAKVKEFANQIPVVNQWVTTDEEAEIERRENILQNQITTLEQDKLDLETNLSIQEAELDQLNQEIARLTLQLEQALTEAESQVQQELDDGLNKVVNTYQEMSAKSAAQVLAELNHAEAVQILAKLDEEQQAAILSALDPETAASYTRLLMD
ncbi:MotE family protein [Amphibacillus indicireducens]|uniref:Magnesium transporter MgtE intracellular domain-containing protein n=1 Tax=Amphibacillus indicireducens TaxID=1076330 RepID=A0ABP7V5K8_9BACI